MKLTYRDKIILAVILAIAVLLLGFFALIKPKYKEIQDNNVQLQKVQEDKSAKEKLINQIPGLKEDITQTYKDTNEIVKMFVPVENVELPEKVDEFMVELAEKNHLKITTVNVASANMSDIPYYFNKEEDKYGEARIGADINGKIQAQINEESAEAAALNGRARARILEQNYGCRQVQNYRLIRF